MKGLLPDEEKEKIGPKNVSSSGGVGSGNVGGRQGAGSKISSAAVISAKPQTNPPPVKGPSVGGGSNQSQPSLAVPLAPPQGHMLTAQTPIMMMPSPMSAMRPPPLMSKFVT